MNIETIKNNREIKKIEKKKLCQDWSVGTIDDVKKAESVTDKKATGLKGVV